MSPLSAQHFGWIAGCAALLSAAPALAQTPTWRDLRVVEQGVEDLGPMGTSMRQASTDLRQPSGFDVVYRVPGSSRGVGGFFTSPAGERLARVDGAITAVFSRSEYVETKKGTKTPIPANTVFYIGHSPLLDLPDTAAPHERSVNAVLNAYDSQASTMAAAPVRNGAQLADMRVHEGADAYFQEPARSLKPDEPAPAANVFTDEQFRQARIRTLLMSAATRGE
jgi:hypothetical protein